jgi:hypothetical protein
MIRDDIIRYDMMILYDMICDIISYDTILYDMIRDDMI